jgi:hypothetical protein
LEWVPVEMGTKMSGASASVQGVALRTLCFTLALLVCGANSPYAIGQAAGVSSFQDDALNITYFYSAHFLQESSSALVAPGDEPRCIKPSLFANSAADRSSFTLYTIAPKSFAEQPISGLSRVNGC